jgi:hypothetical protein
LTAEEAEAWRAHLADYKVDPLFDQLGRPLLSLGSDQSLADEIADRRGWLIEAFKLRSAATKLGYTRAAPGDGGVFFAYEKPFQALGVCAAVEFTGNGLPEENRLGALIGLKFLRMRKGGGFRAGAALPLKDVPSVLLSEAWNDFHAMAAAGTGYAADWEKRTAW